MRIDEHSFQQQKHICKQKFLKFFNKQCFIKRNGNKLLLSLFITLHVLIYQYFPLFPQMKYFVFSKRLYNIVIKLYLNLKAMHTICQY